MDKQILVIFDTDSDSSLYHPKTNKRLSSVNGCFYFIISDKKLFIKSLLDNSFKISEKVYSVLLEYLSFEEGEEILNLKESYHEFGNYSIDIIHTINEI